MPPEDSPALFERKSLLHYHGDIARILFVFAAFVMLGAETLGASMPLSTSGIITFAIVLVIAAGITNPAQSWIHYINFALAIFGTGTFGLFAVEQYQATHDPLVFTYLAAEALALVFLCAVYFTTKTVRGILLRTRLT